MKKEQLLDLYHQMVLIRRVEERGAELYQAGEDRRFHAPVYRAGSRFDRADRGTQAARPRDHCLSRPWGSDELRHTGE